MSSSGSIHDQAEFLARGPRFGRDRRVLAPFSEPDSEVLAITNARIFTAASDEAAFSLALGTLLVQNGIGSGGSFETFAHTPANAGKLREAGVTIALSTFASRGRSVVMEAVMAKAHGLDEAATLRALTLDAAQILGVADEIGSLEAGKSADLVLWENHPLGTWGETRRVIVDGETLFER